LFEHYINISSQMYSTIYLYNIIVKNVNIQLFVTYYIIFPIVPEKSIPGIKIFAAVYNNYNDYIIYTHNTSWKHFHNIIKQ